MKTKIKKELKKYPYKKKRIIHGNSFLSQIEAYERRKRGEMMKYAIIDKKGRVIEKFRLIGAARSHLTHIKKDYYEELIIIELKGG